MAKSWPRWLPFLIVLTYLLIVTRLGGFRSDHVVMAGIPLALYYLGPLAWQFFQFSFPFFLTGIVYDSQRFYSDLIRGPIHVSEP